MLDVSYASSPLTSEYGSSGEHGNGAPVPGERYPDRARLAGTAHHLLIFGEAGGASLLDRLQRRWAGLVKVVRVTGGTRTRLAGDGAVLVRPDGQVGFRADAADVPALRALDAHLDSYLVSAGTPG
jgi:hypothetical protein